MTNTNNLQNNINKLTYLITITILSFIIILAIIFFKYDKVQKSNLEINHQIKLLSMEHAAAHATLLNVLNNISRSKEKNLLQKNRKYILKIGKNYNTILKKMLYSIDKSFSHLDIDASKIKNKILNEKQVKISCLSQQLWNERYSTCAQLIIKSYQTTRTYLYIQSQFMEQIITHRINMYRQIFYFLLLALFLLCFAIITISLKKISKRHNEILINLTNEKEKNVISSMIITYNHEINNPLTSMKIIIEKNKNLIPKKDFIKLSASIDRIVNIMQSIRNLKSKENIKYTAYTQDKDMVNIHQ